MTRQELIKLGLASALMPVGTKTKVETGIEDRERLIRQLDILVRQRDCA